MKTERLHQAFIAVSGLDIVSTIGVSSLCFLIGRDSRQSHLQSAGCQPGEWADDGGLREVGQWCECETWHGSTGACCVDSLRICLLSCLFFLPHPCLLLPNPAAGMDPSHHPLAAEPRAGEDCEWNAGKTGGLQRLPPCPQTTQGSSLQLCFKCINNKGLLLPPLPLLLFILLTYASLCF